MPDRDRGQSFESCPAATGETEAQPWTPVWPFGSCPHFPDGAHRCGADREHNTLSDVHLCTCGTGWRVTVLAPPAVPIVEEPR